MEIELCLEGQTEDFFVVLCSDTRIRMCSSPCVKKVIHSVSKSHFSFMQSKRARDIFCSYFWRENSNIRYSYVFSNSVTLLKRKKKSYSRLITAKQNTVSRCLKITEKVSFNIASEASYVCILSGQKLIKNAKNGPFWRVFENLKLAVKQCYQTGQF